MGEFKISDVLKERPGLQGIGEFIKKEIVGIDKNMTKEIPPEKRALLRRFGLSDDRVDELEDILLKMAEAAQGKGLEFK